MTSSTLVAISNYFRPTRGEALVRVRVNALCLLSICIATYLLPLPSIPSSILAVTSNSHGDGDVPLGWWTWGISLFEVIITALCSYNIVEGLYAIKYPRAPIPPAHLSPLKQKQGLVMSPSPTKRPSSIISPNATPSKIFTTTPSKSLSFSTGSVGQSTPGKYMASPWTTPSRIVRYNMPPQPSSTTSAATNASSTSTMPPTPSPVVAAYRGKQASMSAGRPIDGLYLSQLAGREEDEEEED
ncbi:hypothetical protein E1B28_010844 [Marasmius oreades]|uniref:Uncharacterized protein n=1 Tax=Marasmius oreades TaxID=181124 RepID=A0A9P7RTW7_9AGAR|nr:uncharacterized protein E1B28_010844 [Marasmius oreades]KAG7089136.1 hypothetical protein E1B28_010844 [Marasmius oreades]